MTRWELEERKIKENQRQLNLIIQLKEFTDNTVEIGYIRDNLNGEVIKITECKDSTLRRILKTLQAIHYNFAKPTHRNAIMAKIVTIENEQSRREKLQK